MAHFSKMVDLALTPADIKEDMKDMPQPVGAILSMDEALDRNKYPYGLCLCFGKHEIEKLGLDIEGVEKGDMIHFCGMAYVTHADLGQRDTVGGKSDPNPRLELQVTHLGVEDEDEENEVEEREEKAKSRYGAEEEEPDGEEEYDEPEDTDGKAGELHMETHGSPKDGKESKVAVSREGEVHLSKRHYKAA